MFNIRPLRIEDVDRVGALFRELTDTPINFQAEKLINNPTVFCRVMESEGGVIGFASLTTYLVPTKGIVGRIEDVIINKPYQGRGLGRKMMEDLIEIAKKEKLGYLNLTTNSSRVVARNLYESVGFQIAQTDLFWLKL